MIVPSFYIYYPLLERVMNIGFGFSFWIWSGLLSDDQAIEVAAGEISEHFEGVQGQDLTIEDCFGGAVKEIESVGDAVGETAKDEEGHTEEEWEELLFASEFDGGGHNDAAENGEEEAG